MMRAPRSPTLAVLPIGSIARIGEAAIEAPNKAIAITAARPRRVGPGPFIPQSPHTRLDAAFR
jgi:hypothetical protein